MTPTIRLYLDPAARVWMADFTHATEAAEIDMLFGTTQLPTPYTAVAPAAVVLEGVQARNPHDRVVRA